MSTHTDKTAHKGKRILQANDSAALIAKAAAEKAARAEEARKAAEAAESESATPAPANAETPATAQPEAVQATLEGELAKVTAEHVVPALTAEQEAAIAEAVAAFMALTAEQVQWFAQKVRVRLPKQAAEKKAKIVVDEALQLEAAEIFFGNPTNENYAALQAAKAGILPPKPDYSDKKATIYAQAWKSGCSQRLFKAVEERNLHQIKVQSTLMTTMHTANRTIKTWGKLTLIALQAQAAQATTTA